MGTVYRARDTVLDRFVALKFLHTDRNLEPELKERFYREARLGAKLWHPNIAFIFDLGEAGDDLYIAMELLDGADLRSYIEKKRPMSLERKIELIVQACDGIAHAHRHRVVHRDLKPSNIFIHQDREAKILDFGIARLPTSTLTAVGDVLGTPKYMSPEQIQSKPCDKRSDLFSAAIVFYEFLVYAHPFRSDVIPRRIASEPPNSLYDHMKDCPPGLEELLMRGLAKNPEERIQTAEEFGAGFRRILKLMQSLRPANEREEPQDQVLYATATAGVGKSAATATRDDSRPILEPVPGRGEESIAAAEGPRSGAVKSPIMGADDSLSRAYLLPDPSRLPSETARTGNAPVESGSVSKIVASETPSSTASGAQPNTSAQDRRRSAAGALRAWAQGLRIGMTELAGRLASLPQKFRWYLALGLCVIVAVLGAWLWPASVIPPERSIGHAVVRPPGADIFAGPATSNKKLGSMKAGTRLNVLDHLQSPAQQWVRVQYVSADQRQNSRPGFARVANLSAWSSSDPRVAWEFLLISEPSDSADDPEVQAFIDRLEQFAAQNPEDAVGADIERARLYLMLAQRTKGRGQPPSAREPYLDSASAALNAHAANLDGQEAGARDKLLTEVEAVRSSDKSAIDAQADEQQIASLLAQVQALWNRGDYSAAKARVKQILNINAANQSALTWQRRIRDAEIVEGQN
jgi:serine/threonine protein kinase